LAHGLKITSHLGITSPAAFATPLSMPGKSTSRFLFDHELTQMTTNIINLSMKKKMAIITGYVSGETYGLLGPQLAATVIQENSPFDCIVIAVTREDDTRQLKKALAGYFGKALPVIGFSLLGGREDLCTLAGELKNEGAVTILAGPQANVDFLGEKQWRDHPHRFKGYAHCFSFALHGPVEQIFPFLNDPDDPGWRQSAGILFRMGENDITRNPSKRWEERFLSRVNWFNIHRLEKTALVPCRITTGQVLQQIGCPHAAKEGSIEIGYPLYLDKNRGKTVTMRSKGCTFCDIAADKGFYGGLDMSAVLSQIDALPHGVDGRKIPFELINESPLTGLGKLLDHIKEEAIPISQVNLTMRADWFVKGEKHLRKALRAARTMNVRILLSSMGFEAFDDGILRNLNKGLTVDINLQAVHLIRQLKQSFPAQWGYLRSEGGNHGFIHPTPWDSEETAANTHENMAIHRLPDDILPGHSTPLIIHHASILGDWIRAIEAEESIQFERNGSIISWWQIGDRFFL